MMKCRNLSIKRWTMWCSVWMEEKKSTTECVRLGWKRKYDLIVPKFQKLAESRNQEKYYIRGTFTRENLDFFRGRSCIFADLGF